MPTSPPLAPPLKVALLGCGAVGTQVARLLTQEADHFAARIGAPLQLIGIAVRDVAASRDPIIDRSLLTADTGALVDQADIVIEVMGGIEPARTLALRAIKAGAAVVTANKALLAADGPTLYQAADDARVDMYFEAAVAGAIPIVRPVRESLAGDHIRRVLGIVNGTTNYILDQMATTGADLADALKQAQELGYAEADPTADVEGHDAAAKAAILASLAFHTRVSLDDVACEGIMSITADDVAWAQQTGHVIKLLAIAEKQPGPRTGVAQAGAPGGAAQPSTPQPGADAAEVAGVVVRVHPALVPDTHPLAGVHGAFNAVFVEAESAGDLMFYGRGAGGAPTASAVMGDVVSVARNRVQGGIGPQESTYADLPIRPATTANTRYQIRLDVEDRPGVLAQVALVVAEHKVSIEAVRQPSVASGAAHLVITTHAAPESALAATVGAIGELDAVRSIISVLRVEGA